jgi:hypothetical protein
MKRHPLEKADALVRLLLGLRHPRIAEALASRGFADEDLEEGFQLLRRATRPTMADVQPMLPPPRTDELLAWQREWLPLAAAALQRRCPRAHAHLFVALPELPIIRATTFLERWEKLPLSKRQGGFGPEGRDAIAQLARRGLTEEVLAQGRALAERARSLPTEPTDDGEDEATRFAEADAALWAYCLEWRQAVRSRVKDRRLLRRLGFLKGESGEEEE